MFNSKDYSSKLDKFMFYAFLGAVILHIAVFVFGIFMGAYFAARKKPELEVMRIQIIALDMPSAPAAPPAEVDPNLQGPDVVPLPPVEKTEPQEATVAEETAEEATKPETASPEEVVKTETDVIPIGEKIEEPLDIEKDKTPPPKVEPKEEIDKKAEEDRAKKEKEEKDKKAKEEKDKEDKEKKDKDDKAKKAAEDKAKKEKAEERKLAEAREAIKRKVEADEAQKQIDDALANINIKHGGGQGESSQENYGSTSGQKVHPAIAAYYGEVRRIVIANWIPPTSSAPTGAVAYFDLGINTNGTVYHSKIFKASGSPDYDLSVERAIKKSSFPALPAAFEGKRSSIRLDFNLKDMH